MRKILIVGYSEFFIEQCKLNLKKEAVLKQVDFVSTRNDAMRKINGNTYGLVLTDDKYPVLPHTPALTRASIEFLRYAKEKHFSGKVVFCTSSPDTEKQVATMTVNKQPVLTFLNEKISTSVIRECIRKCIELVR